MICTLLAYYQNQQYLEAVDLIKSTLTDSTSFDVLNQLGYCYRMARDHKNAAHYYLKVLDIDSLHLPTLSSLASIHYICGNTVIAKDYYERVLHVDSNHVNTLFTIAGLTRHQYDSTGNSLATSYYERAYSLQPNNIDIVLDYAQHLSDLKKFTEADHILNQALLHDSFGI